MDDSVAWDGSILRILLGAGSTVISTALPYHKNMPSTACMYLSVSSGTAGNSSVSGMSCPSSPYCM
eukprot:5528272-Ditylum_brightwellii.AAC.1